MKTRVISTEIWDEDNVFSLNIDTKLVYLILLTNPYIGQSRFYKINDRQLSTFSGLNIEQIKKCKKDLEESKMAFFKDGYVCLTGYGFIECFYKGSKNQVAKMNEIDKIPKDILSFFFKKLDTLSIPYQYPSDTTINHKSGIINNKSGIINQESDEETPVIPTVEEVVISKFKKPTVIEIQAYCDERKNGIDANQFFDHYQSNGWRVGGKAPMKDWKASIRTWERNGYSRTTSSHVSGKAINLEDPAEVEKLFSKK